MGVSMGSGALAGGLLGGFVGGVPGAIIGAGIGAAITGGIDSAIADYNGDDARATIAAELGGAGFGAAVGGAIGTAILPGIGTALGAGIGTVLGTVLGWVTETLSHTIFSDGGPFSNLKISEKDLAWATEETTKAQATQLEMLEKLKVAEELSGESGQRLYDMLQNGTLSYEDMTSAQLTTVRAYELYQQSVEATANALKRQTDYENAILRQKAEETGDWSAFIESMQTACDNGIYTSEEFKDKLSQIYAEVHGKSREAFVEQLPEDMRQGVEDGAYQYLSGWERFSMAVSERYAAFKTNWHDFWEDVKTTVSEKWQNIYSAITEWANTIKESVWKMFDGLRTSAEETWQRICNFFSGKGFKTNEQTEGDGSKKVSIQPYATGTNYVPSDGLAYLHRGEAVIPAKYNKPYSPDNTNLENAIGNLIRQVEQIGSQVNQGIKVNGEFRQRGSDLVAVVNRTNSQIGASIISDASYAR